MLGGRGMEIIYSHKDLKKYIDEAVKVSGSNPVLIDRFLNDATGLTWMLFVMVNQYL